jgi:hypothetical protein
MEGRDEEIKANVSTQQDDDSIQMKSDQVMEDINKHDNEQVINKEFSFFQKKIAPIKQVSNSLPIRIEPIQLV